MMNPFPTLAALFLLLCLPVLLTGQTDFKFVTRSNAETAGEMLTSGKDYDRAKKIYDQLVEARGDRRFPVPKFVLSTSDQNVAYLESDGLSIGLEIKAINTINKMSEADGDNALAALLGHELTHFYEKHQWRRGFAAAYDNLQVGRDLKSDTDLYKLSCETQADYLGGFLAYSAGFPVYEKLPEFYDEIYKAYGLRDTMKGYAVKDDRIAMAAQSLESLKKLVEVFEMANLMTAIGRYDDARAFYQHILTQYQGREIYNNLGVLTVLSAYRYFAEDERKYRLPVELDLNFGVNSKDAFGEDKEKTRRALLQEAILYFDNAVSMDPDYAPAYLNKACAYYLLGTTADLERARFYAAVEAKAKAAAAPEKFKKATLDAEVLLALLEEKAGNAAQAKKMLSAVKDQSSVANYNLIIMNGQTPPKGKKSGGPEDEEIDGLENGDMYTFTRNNNNDKNEQVLFGAVKFRVWEDKGGLKHSKLYVCKAPAGIDAPDVYIHLTDPGYPGETLDGYKVGTTRKTITDAYGEPGFSLPTTGGEIMVYEEVLFIMDQQGKLSRFANYFLK